VGVGLRSGVTCDIVQEHEASSVRQRLLEECAAKENAANALLQRNTVANHDMPC